ncbi:MAG: nuclear transport factor 2 family protein [Bryobacteraceae bacterium]|nr:nuclear transport factor 2 family protein [Bryobacteraceae bacterium]
MTVEEEIIGLETRALERWGNGDPDGFLELCDPEVTYFDPFSKGRLDLDALRALYESIRGQVRIDSFQLVEPRVQVHGDLAILTFRFVSRGSEGSLNWHTTEVYRRCGACWRILHTHWSLPRD